MRPRVLHLAKDLSLPLDAVTETFAILGRRGSGKTHTAVVMAEEMLAAGVPVVIIDPLDVWWGLRVSKDGKKAGFPIYVCGGSHQDVPLSADAGRILADVVVDRAVSMVLSLRHLSKTDQRRFVGEFCERLYDRKADPAHRTALHVFIDEADAFVPQRLVPGTERCFGAVDTLVRRGRSSGLAPTLISQRPQVINKDVLSQTEVLVAHQLTGPQDRKALETWIEANDTDNRQREFMASLASLQKGDTWFWSPGMLGIFTRVHVRDRQTFDSSATPKPGVQVAAPKAFAAVDLAQLTAEIAATIEKAKADDPKELRKQLAALNAELHNLRKSASAPRVEEVHVPFIPDPVRGQVSDLAAAVERFNREMSEALRQHGQDVERELRNLSMMVSTIPRTEAQEAVTVTAVQAFGRRFEAAGRTSAPVATRPESPSVPSTRPASAGPGQSLKPMHRAMLTALAQHPDGLTKRKIRVHTGYADSGPVSKAFADLLREGFVTPRDYWLVITPKGLDALGPYEPLPIGDALRQHLLTGQKLNVMEKALLRHICEAYPDDISKGAARQAAGYADSGPVSRAFARLVEFDYVTKVGVGRVRAAEELFS